MKHAIDSLGIGTVADCADYYRINRNDAAKAVTHLVEIGEIEEVKVEGVRRGKCSLCPVSRFRTCLLMSVQLFRRSIRWRGSGIGLEWLFNFEYRIEIYTPVKKRKYGYYVLPFILGNRFVARVDLKADRQKRVLRVPGGVSGGWL